MTLAERIIEARGASYRTTIAAAAGIVDASRSTMQRWERPTGPDTGRHLVPLLRAVAPPQTWLVELAARCGITAGDALALAQAGDVAVVAARLRGTVPLDDVAEWMRVVSAVTVTTALAHEVDALRHARIAMMPRRHR